MSGFYPTYDVAGAVQIFGRLWSRCRSRTGVLKKIKKFEPHPDVGGALTAVGLDVKITLQIVAPTARGVRDTRGVVNCTPRAEAQISYFENS
jgi:hypothetical protein